MTATAIRPTTAAVVAGPAHREPHAPIPFTRVLGVELRKMFDTRFGLWLMVSIVLASALATGAVLVFSPADELTYARFAAAIAIPMSVILPLVAVLAVTSEWSQRSALTTFTLVPGRGRVMAAKLCCTVAIGLVAMLVAVAVGALGNVVGTAIAGAQTSWDLSLAEYARATLASEIGMLVGFVLGVVLRSSAAAIVGYFVYSLVMPGVTAALMATQQWYYDHVGWFDLNFATSQLFTESVSGTEWLQLGVTGLLWVVVPLAVGLRFLLRSEIK